MKWMLGFLGQLLSGVFSVASGGLTLINNMLAFGFRTALQYHEKSIAFSRAVGMSFSQAAAYTSVLSQRAIELGQKYGIAAEAVMKLEESLDNATNRQLMLSDVEAERMVRINKLVGEQVTSKFFEEMMVGMGAQIKATEGAVSKAYAEAAKRGLNASKMAEKVAQNLGMANRFSFRNGVDGLTKMVIQAEKLGASMSSIESAMGQFLELDSAIETAAQMQMLGGSAAAMFGNPLTAAFEANYDPEAFQQRLIDSLGSYASFDEKKGMATIGGMNMSSIRAIAQAMHISVDDASKMAKKQAEVRYKENRFSPQLKGLSETERDYVLNRSQIEGNRLTIGGKDVSELKRNGELKKMMEYANMSSEEIELRQAMELTSINEKLQGIWTSLGGQLAEVFNKHMPNLLGFVDSIGKSLNNAMPKITKALDEAITKLITPENIKNIEEIINMLASKGADLIASGVTLMQEAINGIRSGIDWLNKIDDSIDKLKAALTGWVFYKSFKDYLPKVNGGTNGANGANRSNSQSGSNPKGGNSPGGSSANGAASGAASGRKGKGSANPSNPNSGGNLNKNSSNTIRYKGKEYFQDSQGNWKQRLGNGGTKNVNSATAKELNAVKSGYQQGVNATTKAATNAGAAEGGANAAINTAKASRLANGLQTGKTFLKGSWPVAAVIGGIEAGLSIWDYFDSLEDLMTNPNYSREDKKKMLQAARKKTETNAAGAVGGAGGAILGTAAAGAAMGTVFPGAGNFAGAVVGAIGGAIGYYLGSKGVKSLAEAILDPNEVSDDELDELLKEYEGAKAKPHKKGGIINDGISGEHLISAEDNEAVLNPEQQRKFMAIANGEEVVKANPSVNESAMQKNFMAMSNTETPVKSTPVVGEKPEYVYRPSKTEISSVNGNTITVKDFNVHMDGTIKLDAGTASRTLNMSEVLRSIDNDPTFKRALADLLYESIKERSNREMNNGRFLNDSPTKA